MSYIRIKWIKGNPYLYEQTSYRVGKQVKSKHIRYIGRFGYGASGFPLLEKIKLSRKRAIDKELLRLQFGDNNFYERDILRQCLSQHSFSFNVGRSRRLRKNKGYVLAVEDKVKPNLTKVIDFGVRKKSEPFTWMHELGHMLEYQDHIVTEEINKLRDDFIAVYAQAYYKAVGGSLEDKETFIKQYASLIDIRDDLADVEKASQPPRQLKDRWIGDLLELTKAGKRPQILFADDFRDWFDEDYRILNKREIFADTVASLIINPKRAFDTHTAAGKKYVSKVYVKLFTHLEEKYKISLGRPKKNKRRKK